MAEDPFFFVGGTVPTNRDCYIQRSADKQLLQNLLADQLCYVLTSRQMGKSSLMARTAERLKDHGRTVAVLDLSALGKDNVTADQWYRGLLRRLGKELSRGDLEAQIDQHWKSTDGLGPLQRWMTGLCEVVLPRCPNGLVIFIDEIDTTLGLKFSADEFFAAIRECYNRRSVDPQMQRLTFCLLGVATPADLIQDPRTTPFNVGRRIELADFTAAEAAGFQTGLERGHPDHSAELIARILYWTGGQPYLTQRLCQAVADDPDASNARGVDRCCHALFLAEASRDRDDNLRFVRRGVLRPDADPAALLDVYARIRAGKAVADDETNRQIDMLRLAGLVRARAGRLDVRNRIYREVFDKKFINENMPDAERRRQRSAYRRGLRRAGLAAAVVIGLLVVVAWELWAYYMPPAPEYFAGWVNRWGVAEGRRPLSWSDVQHRSVAYKFYRNSKSDGGRVTRVEVLSGGRLTADSGIRHHWAADGSSVETSQRYSAWEYTYDDDGNLVYERAMAQASPVNSAGGNDDHAHQSKEKTGQGNAAREALATEKTSQGNAAREALPADRPGSGTAARDNAAHDTGPSRMLWAYAYSPMRGNKRAAHLVDQDGFPHPDARNLFIEFEYDLDTGFDYVIHFHSPDGKLALNQDGYAREVRTLDARGNRVETAYYDLRDHLTLVKGQKYCRVRSKFDERNRRSERAYFDLDDRPAPVKDEIYCVMRYQYDEYDREVESAYFDAGGQPAPIKGDGYCRVQSRFDDFGREIERTFCNADGGRKATQNGYAGWHDQHDDHGNLTERAYFDEKGEPAFFGTEKFCIQRYMYDASDRIIERSYFGAKGEPAPWKFDGYCQVQYRYDAAGRETERIFCDADGKPKATTENYASWRDEFDPRGNRTSRVYLDESGKPVIYKGGTYCQVRYDYDATGHETERSFYGPDGRLAITSEALAGWRQKFDDRGYLLETAYFDAKKQPHICKAGYAFYEADYDHDGHAISRSFLGPDRRPADRADGEPSRIMAEYNADGRLIEETNLYEAAPHKDGYAKSVVHYDANERLIEVLYFDGRDQPAADKFGCSRWTRAYDADGHPVQIAFWGLDGKPARNGEGGASKTISEYDAQGRLTKNTVFYDAGPHTEGYEKCIKDYDARGNLLVEAYFDAHDKPVVSKDNGCARIELAWGDNGKVTAGKYFGVDGRPAKRKPVGDSRFTNEYDSQGRLLIRTLFVEPEPHALGFSQIMQRLDPNGNEIEQAYFDAQGRPMVRNDAGYAKVLKTYTAGGQLATEAYFGTDGKPVAKKPSGESRITLEYNQQGKLDIKTLFFEVQPHADGYRKLVNHYDAAANVIDQAYYDNDGKLFPDKDGCARWTSVYDARANRLEQAYFGVDNRPVLDPLGYARWTAEFDTDNNRLATRYFGRAGEQLQVETTITEVSTGGQAEKLGLKPGDILVSYDGEPITDYASFFARRRGEKPDSSAGEPATRKLEVRRAGTMMSFSVKTGVLLVTLQDHCVGEAKPLAALSDLKKKMQPAPAPTTPIEPADHGAPTIKAVKKLAPGSGLKLVVLYLRNAHPDEELLNSLESALQDRGHQVFIDREPTAGVNWSREFDRRMREADAVIVLLSASSVQSGVFATEAENACDENEKRGGKPRVLPVRVHYDAKLPGKLSILNRMHQFSWSGAGDNARLVRELDAALAAPIEPPRPLARDPK